LGDASAVAEVLGSEWGKNRVPKERNLETEGEVIELGLRRTIEGRDTVMRSLIRAVYRLRDATLVAKKKDDFGNALQNLYRELERAEDLVGPLSCLGGDHERFCTSHRKANRLEEW
jgi:hypothetical protein